MTTPLSHAQGFSEVGPLGNSPNVSSRQIAAALSLGTRTWSRVAIGCRSMAAIFGVLLAGIAVRTWLTADASLGHQDDINLFVDWTRRLQELGIRGFYESNVFCDYPPLSILMFRALGWLASFHPAALADADLLKVLLKVPACLADVAIAIMIYIECGRFLGRRAATAAAALFFLNPVVLYDSAYWGQVDSIFTAFVLLSVMLVARGRWHWAGAAIALGMLAKFQSIAFVPLLLFETYRIGGWKAIGGKVVAALAIAACVLMPFATSETMDDVLQRSYVNVVGQYNDLSKSAFNIWYLTGEPHAADLGVPAAIVSVAAGHRLAIADDASWLLRLNYRKISLIGYALAVAVILSVYSFRTGPVSRHAAAGLLGLAFFLFPTEMHERYALPALAFLAIWAASGAWAERAFVMLSALLERSLY